MSRRETRFSSSVLSVISLLVASAGASAAPPAPIYSNAGPTPTDPGLATGATTRSGVAAPGGGLWSELQSDPTAGANAVAGFSNHSANPGGAYRFADDFTVTGTGFGWEISSIDFFAYQTDAGSSSSPFATLNVRIWNGRPGDVGRSVVWGDTVTNRLISSTPTNIYRTFSSDTVPSSGPISSNRRVWMNTASTPGLRLTPGVYWVDWQYTTVNPSLEAFTPAVTIVGARGKAGANARQLRVTDGVTLWADLVDAGKPASAADVGQDLPFIITAAPAPGTCPGDADLNGIVTFNDLTTVLSNLGASYPQSSGPGDSNGDGTVSFSDVTITLVNFGITCS